MVLFTKGRTQVSGIYTLKGGPCDPSVTTANLSCPNRVQTSWVATCSSGDLDPGGSGKCRKTSIIAVKWKIFQEFQIPGATSLAPIETSTAAGAQVQATELSVMHIMASSGIAQNCPA
ncbi:MAG: hypothetical protein H7222_07760 [Methylotenera sp.]|nr:hypothetical protein [Oligoflexia bacterium]